MQMSFLANIVFTFALQTQMKQESAVGFTYENAQTAPIPRVTHQSGGFFCIVMVLHYNIAGTY